MTYEFKVYDEVINMETSQRGIITTIPIEQKITHDCIVKFNNDNVAMFFNELKSTGVQCFEKDQAARHNTDKPQLSYLLDFPHALEEFAFLCEFGAKKYARNNWKKGFPFTELEDSLLRHLLAFHKCEDNDKEHKMLHLTSVMWSAMALIEGYCDKETKEKFDNRDHKLEET